MQLTVMNRSVDSCPTSCTKVNEKIEIQHPVSFYLSPSSSCSLSECGKGLPSLKQLVMSKAKLGTDRFPPAVLALL